MREGTATYLQIDLQNLFRSSASRGQRLDLEKILKHLKERETEFLIGAVVYTVRGTEFDSSRFESKLKNIGYEIRAKNLPKQSVRNRKNNREVCNPINLDVLITMECMAKSSLFDKWILISNNGSFSDLSKYLREHGKQVEVWSFRENYDPSLELYADKIHFLEDSFCLKKSNISVFGINWGLEKFDSTSMQGYL